TLSYLGSTTPVLTYSGVAATDIANIENALNANTFASIGGLAPFANTPYAARVSVTANVTDTVFNITFGGELQDQPLPALISVNVTSATGTGSAVTRLVRAGSGQPTDVYTITLSGVGFAGTTQPLLAYTTS